MPREGLHDSWRRLLANAAGTPPTLGGELPVAASVESALLPQRRRIDPGGSREFDRGRRHLPPRSINNNIPAHPARRVGPGVRARVFACRRLPRHAFFRLESGSGTDAR
jgi:hypothetical protein